MKVNINAVNFKASSKLDLFINEKLEKLTDFYDRIIGSDVTLKLGNNTDTENKIAEIRLVIRGYDLFAKKQSKSFEEAVCKAAEALRRQLKKHKEKLKEA